MKPISTLILSTVFSVSLFAQNVEDTSLSLVVPASDSAAYYYGNTLHKTPVIDIENKPVVIEKKFIATHKKISYRRNYKVTTATNAADVYQRALSFAAIKNPLYTEDVSKKIITFPVTWQYYGFVNECITKLELEGNVKLEVKGVKTRISLSDITYLHTNSAGEEAPVSKSEILGRNVACAPKEGVVELLFNCKECTSSVQSLESSLGNYFETLADDYQDSLK